MKVIDHEESLRKLIDSVNAAQKEQVEITQKNIQQDQQGNTKPEEKPTYQAPASIPLYSDMQKAKKS